MAGPSHTCSSSSSQRLWSYTPSPSGRPSTVVLQSICLHEPLRSIALAPMVREPQSAPPPAQPAAPAPSSTACRQQQMLWQPDALQRDQQERYPQLQVVQPQPAQDPGALQQLLAAAKWQLPVSLTDLQLLLQQLVPIQAGLKSMQLAQIAEAVASLPDGPAAAVATPDWTQSLLAAASQRFAQGCMGERASSTLLQALVHLAVQPSEEWLQGACAGMAVATWRGSRALSTVAACLPQLGHVPSSSWAAGYFACTADKLHALPAISLARMLHGVVAWRHLQQEQQDKKAGAAQHEMLALPAHWLCDVLQRLHACSSELKPCEVAMVVQALQRLQQPGLLSDNSFTTMDSSSSSSSSSTGAADVGGSSGLLQASGQQPESLLQLSAQQLLHALMPAVIRLRREFGAQDFAVVLHSLARLHQQQEQQQQDTQGSVTEQLLQDGRCLCSWGWLDQVLATAQECLPAANARTQTTMLWASAVLLQPHIKQQEQRLSQQQRQQEQHQRQQQQLLQWKEEPSHSHQLPQQAAAVPAAAATRLTAQQAQLPLRGQQGQPALARPARPAQQQRPQWPLQQQQQQQQPAAAAAAGLLQATPAGSMDDGTAAAATLSASARASHARDTAAASMWVSVLERFYAASLPRLQAFSTDDLVMTACTLATRQQVPPVAWYEQLLSAVSKALPAMTPGQVSGVAWALGKMALLPCRHNPGVSLVPLQPWLQQLYAHSGMATPAAAAAAAAPTPVESAPTAVAGATEQAGDESRVVQHVSSDEVVRLMWAAAVCDFDPGDAWWAAAELLLLSPVDSTQGTGSRPAASRTTADSDTDFSFSTQSSQQHQHQQGEVAAQTTAAVVQQLSAHLWGTLVQAYVSSGRQLPAPLLQALCSPAVARQLAEWPVGNTLRLLQGLRQAGCTVPQHWLQQLALGMQDKLVRLRLGELAQLLLGLAGVGFDAQQLPSWTGPSSSSSGSASGWVAAVFAACHLQVQGASARDVSMLLSGVANLRLQLPQSLLQALLQQLQLGFLDASPAALSGAIDALTRLGVMPSRDWLGAYLMATHRIFTATAASLNSGSISTSSSSIRSRVVLVESVLQTLQGLARMKAVLPAKWLKQQLLVLHGQLPVLQPRHVASLLLLLARLKCRPSAPYLHSMLQHLGDCRACSALDLVHIAYGIASLRWQPNKQWMRVFLGAAAEQLQLLSNQGLALLLWALGVSRVMPGLSWRRAAVEAVAARLGQFDALQLSMVVWALGRMAMHLTPLPHRLTRQQPALQRSQQPPTQHQADDVAAGAHDGSVATGSTSSRVVASAPAKAAVRRTNWLPHGRQVAQQLLVAALQLRGSFNAAQLTHLLVGLAKLHLPPNQVWLEAMVTQGSSQPLSVLDGYQMQQLLWALARLQYRAPAAWVDSMGLLLETKWQQHDSTRHSAAWAMQQLHKRAVHPSQQGPGVVEERRPVM